MKNIFTSIDIGCDSVKIVVLEKINKKFVLLASTSVPNKYIINGEVASFRGLVSVIKRAKNDIYDLLGIEITKAICLLNPIDLELDIINGRVLVDDRNNISGFDISNLLNNSVGNINFNDKELVTSIPINFIIDGQKQVKDPKGYKGEVLESKIVVSSINKKYMYKVLEVLKFAGIDAIDVCFKSTGDYFASKDVFDLEGVGALVNIGEESTNVSIFNKGIQIKNEVINMGSVHVDRDISYIYNCSNTVSRDLKENFSYAYSAIADENKEKKVIDREEKERVIKQVGISKIVEARVREILKLSSNEIKNLTNRKISYIIITGGLSELKGMDNLVDVYFGSLGKILNMNVLGIRHNKYSSSYGSVLYYDDKLLLRDKESSFFNDEDINRVISIDKERQNTNNIINKVFGHFFD